MHLAVTLSLLFFYEPVDFFSFFYLTALHNTYVRMCVFGMLIIIVSLLTQKVHQTLTEDIHIAGSSLSPLWEMLCVPPEQSETPLDGHYKAHSLFQGSAKRSQFILWCVLCPLIGLALKNQLLALNVLP